MTRNSDPDMTVVTRVIAYNVRLGHDEEFQAWQKSINSEVEKFPGVLRVDVLPSNVTDAGHEWIVVYRFDSDENLTAWLNSAQRTQSLAHAPDILAGAETAYTLHGAEAADTSETIVTSNEVIPGKEAEYEAADRSLNEAAARFPGFAGAKVFRPSPGSQTWSTMIRFDNKANMERWLESPERAAGRQAMYRFALSHHADVVPTGFGSWFAVNAEDGIQAPAWKQAMVVLCALFPAVMILNLTVSRIVAAEGIPFAVNIFIGNALSTVALTWLLMPVVTRLMAWWLSPRCTEQKTWLGVFLALGIYVIELALFTAVPST